MPTMITTNDDNTVMMFTTSIYPGKVCIGIIYDNGAFSVWRKGSAKYIRRMWNNRSYSPW